MQELIELKQKTPYERLSTPGYTVNHRSTLPEIERAYINACRTYAPDYNNPMKMAENSIELAKLLYLQEALTGILVVHKNMIPVLPDGPGTQPYHDAAHQRVIKMEANLEKRAALMPPSDAMKAKLNQLRSVSPGNEENKSPQNNQTPPPSMRRS